MKIAELEAADPRPSPDDLTLLAMRPGGPERFRFQRAPDAGVFRLVARETEGYDLPPTCEVVQKDRPRGAAFKVDGREPVRVVEVERGVPAPYAYEFVGELTPYVSTCRKCHRRFRVSEADLAWAVAEHPDEPEVNAAYRVQMCLDCSTGAGPEGEHLTLHDLFLAAYRALVSFQSEAFRAGHADLGQMIASDVCELYDRWEAVAARISEDSHHEPDDGGQNE